MGGLIKDVAVGTWFVLIALAICGIIVTAFSDEYCRAYEKSPQGSQNQNTAYYTSQYTRALGGLTAFLCFLYVAWIFVDSRHPAKSGLWSFSTHRIQQSRLQAKRQHIVKLSVFVVVIFIAWVPPAFILAFEGWLYRGRDNAHQALQSSVCSNGNRSNCEELKKVGISSIVMTVLLFIALLFTVVPLIVKKKVPILTEPEMREKIKKADEAKAANEKKAAIEAENKLRRKLHLPEIADDGFDPLAGRADQIIQDAFFPPRRRRRGSSPRTPPPQPIYAQPYGPAPGHGFPGFAGGGGGTNIVGFGIPMPSYGGAPPYQAPPPQAPPYNPYGYTPLSGYAPPPPSPAYRSRHDNRYRRGRRSNSREAAAAYMTGVRGSSLSSRYTPSTMSGSPYRWHERSRAEALGASPVTRPVGGGQNRSTAFPSMFRTNAAPPVRTQFVNLAGRRNAPMPPRLNTSMLAARQQSGLRSGVGTGRYSARYTPSSARPFLHARTPGSGTPYRRTFR